MTPTEQNIIVQRSARYYILGETANQVKKVWLVFHGYGQLARFFIQKFEQMVDDETIVVALEGHSKFYLEGYSGRVGANWMTSENRENEIEDQYQMIDQIKDELQQSCPEAEFSILGFSQGVHTASRWINNRRPELGSFIMWGAFFPQEMATDIGLMNELTSKTRTDFVIGDNDEFATPERRTKIENVLARMDSIYLHTFQGGHEIIPEVLRTVINQEG